MKEEHSSNIRLSNSVRISDTRPRSSASLGTSFMKSRLIVYGILSHPLVQPEQGQLCMLSGGGTQSHHRPRTSITVFVCIRHFCTKAVKNISLRAVEATQAYLLCGKVCCIQ